MENATTKLSVKPEKLTVEDILEAVRLVDELPEPEVRVVKAGIKARNKLAKFFHGKRAKSSNKLKFGGTLYGIPVYIDPELKANEVVFGDRRFTL